MTTRPVQHSQSASGVADACRVTALFLNQRGWVEIPATGISMYPFIRNGDVCRFGAVDADRSTDAFDVEPMSVCLRPGDVALFKMGTDRLVAHRVIRFTEHGGQVCVVTRGDNLDHPDEPVPLSSVLGRLVDIRRSGARLNIHSRSARTWGYMAVHHPGLVRAIRRVAERRFVPKRVACLWRSRR